MALPGATQVVHLARLITSRPQLTRMPDQSLIASPNPEQPERHLKAIRDREGRFAFIYTPTGEPFRVNLAPLGKQTLTWRWFDPRAGTMGDASPVVAGEGGTEFRPPTSGPGQDWVLVLDAAETPAKR